MVAKGTAWLLGDGSSCRNMDRLIIDYMTGRGTRRVSAEGTLSFALHAGTELGALAICKVTPWRTHAILLPTHRLKTTQRRPKVLHDLIHEHLRFRQILQIGHGGVLQPEHVKARLVALK